jgi:hypothetical protein
MLMINRNRMLLQCGISLIWLAVFPSYATNKASVSGVATKGCVVDWTAQTVMDIDLTNDDPIYPNLMALRDGTPVTSYSNGGYIQEVRPEYSDPGIFEINHWYASVGDDPTSSAAGAMVFWRIPVATDYAILNPTVTVTLPAGLNVNPYSFAPVPANIAAWNSPYSNYVWASGSTGQDNLDGTWTITLNNLATMAGTVFTLSATVPAGTDLTKQYLIKATLSGTYVKDGGSSTCMTQVPPASVATPVPTLGKWALALLSLAVAGFAAAGLRRSRVR